MRLGYYLRVGNIVEIDDLSKYLVRKVDMWTEEKDRRFLKKIYGEVSIWTPNLIMARHYNDLCFFESKWHNLELKCVAIESEADKKNAEADPKFIKWWRKADDEE